MTLPDERFRAASRTRDFLLELCTPSATPRVPSWVRDRARVLLRHYPTELDLDMAAEALPDLFSRNRVYFSPPAEEWPKYEAQAKDKKSNWMNNFLFGKKNQK